VHFLHISNAADGWWQEELAWHLVIVEDVWNLLGTNFSFPQAVDEDTVKICLSDSNFCSNCRAWSAACIFKDRFHLFHVVFLRHWCWGFTVRALSVSSWPLMAFIHPQTVSCEGVRVPKPPSMTCNTLKYSYPT
jgi:hypothetical protein